MASLTADDANGEYEEFKISSEALAHYLECQLHEVESVLLCKLPLTAEITARENEIIEIKNWTQNILNFHTNRNFKLNFWQIGIAAAEEKYCLCGFYKLFRISTYLKLIKCKFLFFSFILTRLQFCSIFLCVYVCKHSWQIWLFFKIVFPTFLNDMWLLHMQHVCFYISYNAFCSTIF